MTYNNVCYSLADDGELDLEDLWSDAIEKYGTMPKETKHENEPNKQPQKEKKNMKKSRTKKHIFLILTYIIFIIVELFFCVPYHRIQTFVSNQNVPHTEIIGSGYTTMSDIESNMVYIYNHTNTSRAEKRVNTPQLFMNVSVTTFLAVAIYFLMQKNEKIKELPTIDINALAFATEDEVEKAQQDYAIKMYEYIKKKG